MYHYSKKSADIRNKTTNIGVFRYIINLLNRNKLGEILVLKGHISPSDLRAALHKQAQSQKPLGQIFLEHSHITKYQLAQILFRQKIIRLSATAVLCFASIGGISKKTHAKSMKKSTYSQSIKKDVLERISLSENGASEFKTMNKYPDIFGAKERKSTNLKAFTKWAGMFDRFEKSLNKRDSNRVIQDLKTEISQFKSSSIYEMANDVNKMMNKKKYVVDSKNWGKSDYWATPIEFMTRGGDCEDFAIAKYIALHALGVPEERMRIAIVQDQIKNMPHAILIVYSERGAMVLDNQIKTIRRADNIAHYKPIFSINRTAWWLHTPQEKPTTIIVSAR